MIKISPIFGQVNNYDISMIETGQIRIKYEKTGIYSILNEVRDIIFGEKLKENKTAIEIILKIDPEFYNTCILRKYT